MNFWVDNNQLDSCHSRNGTNNRRYTTSQQESNPLLEHNLQSRLGTLHCEILCLNIFFTSHLATGNTNILLHPAA
jgi:hypothetical protein